MHGCKWLDAIGIPCIGEQEWFYSGVGVLIREEVLKEYEVEVEAVL